MRAVILGGGISGLTAALSLRRSCKSVEIVVLEGSNRLGGWLHSFRQNGLLFEHGGRGIRPVGPSGTAALQLIESIPGLPEKTIVASPAAQTRYLLFGGQVLPVPTSPIDALTSPLTSPLILPIFRLAAAAGLSAAGLRTLSVLLAPGASALPAYEDLSVHSYALRLFGDTDGGATAVASLIRRLRGGANSPSPALGSAGSHLSEVLLDAVMSGIYAGDVRSLSAKAVLAALWNMERSGGADGLPESLGMKIREFVGKAFKRGKRSSDAGEAPAAAADELSPFVKACMSSSSVAFTGGMQTMIDALASEVVRISAPGSGIMSARSSQRCKDELFGPQRSSSSATTAAEGSGRTYIVTEASVISLLLSAWTSDAAHQRRRQPLEVHVALGAGSGAGSGVDTTTATATTTIAADYAISSLPSNTLARVLRKSSSSTTKAATVTASSRRRLLLEQASEQLDTIPFASVALVNLGYKGKNHLPGPSVVEQRKKQVAAAAGAALQSDDRKKKKTSDKDDSAPQFAGFGYLAPYCERRLGQSFSSPAVAAGTPFAGLGSLAGKPISKRAETQSRYSSSPAAGVLGMTWDSTVFPGQALSHAEGVGSGRIAPRKDEKSGCVLPGRDVDVGYSAAEGETRVTVMMGGAMHQDLVEHGLLLTGDAENGKGKVEVDRTFAVFKALSAATAHVGLPAKPDEISVAVARDAIPQYNLNHQQRVLQALESIAQAYSSPSGSASGGHDLALDVIGNSFHGVGIADSIREGLAAGKRAAMVLDANKVRGQ